MAHEAQPDEVSAMRVALIAMGMLLTTTCLAQVPEGWFEFTISVPVEAARSMRPGSASGRRARQGPSPSRTGSSSMATDSGSGSSART